MIDDNPADGDIVKRFLSDEKFPWTSQFELANSLREAEKKLEEKEFDLILLDYRFPFGTGFDVLARLRNEGVDLPVIMLTGQGSEEVAGKAVKETISDYLPKSELSPERLQEAVESILNIEKSVSSEQSISRLGSGESSGFKKIFTLLSQGVNIRFIFVVCKKTAGETYYAQCEKFITQKLGEGSFVRLFPLEIGENFVLSFLNDSPEPSISGADSSLLAEMFEKLESKSEEKNSPVSLLIMEAAGKIENRDPAFLLNRMLDKISTVDLQELSGGKYIKFEAGS